MERKPGLDLADAVAVNLNAMAGLGVFVALGIGADLAGPGVLLALLVAGLLAAITASAPSARTRPLFMSLAAVPCVAAAGGMFAAYIAPLGATHVHRQLAAGAIAAVTALAVVLRHPLSARVSGAFLALKVGALAFLAGMALPMLDRAHFHPVLPHGTTGLWKAAGLLVIAFAGFRHAESTTDGLAPPPPASGPLSAVLAVALYVVVAFAAIGSAGLLFSGHDLAGQPYNAPLLIVAALSNLPLPARVVVTIGAAAAAVSAPLVLLSETRRAAAHWSPATADARWFPLVPGAAALILAFTASVPDLLTFAALALLIGYGITNAVASLRARGAGRLLHGAAALACVFLAAYAARVP